MKMWSGAESLALRVPGWFRPIYLLIRQPSSAALLSIQPSELFAPALFSCEPLR
jgi:hypothetical protein